MKQDNYIQKLHKSEQQYAKAQRMAKKYKRLAYEKLGKHIATHYLVPKVVRNTQRKNGKVTHTNHILTDKHKHPILTKYYTYRDFAKNYRIVPVSALAKKLNKKNK